MNEIKYNDSDHTYWVGNVRLPSVTEILQDEGFINNTWYDEWSCTRGTYVHRAIELYNSGALLESDLDERLVPYLDAWRRFKENVSIQIIASEKMVYSAIFQYAGRLDILCEINREKSIIDLKSGIVDSATALQLAGYAICFEGYYSIKRYGLSLKDGKATIRAFNDPKDFEIWKALVAIHWYKLNNNIIKKRRNNGKGKD